RCHPRTLAKIYRADITSSGKDISPVLSRMPTGASLARKVNPKETGNVRRTLWARVRVGVRGAAGKLWVRRWLVLGGSWQVAWWTIRRRQDVRPGPSQIRNSTIAR